MYDEMTNADLIVVAYEKAHPSDNPSSENADLIDELCRRLRKMEGYRIRMHELSDQVDANSQDMLMKYDNPWPPVEPKDEKRYDIELRDGTTVEDVEFWAFGGGFKPSEEKKGTNQLTDYPLSEVVSFSLSND